MSTRQRALVLLMLGSVCLAPVLAITAAYYAHIWSSPWGVGEDWPVLALMSLVYLSIVGGPVFVTGSALVMLRSAKVSHLVLNWAFVGGLISAAWSTFFVAAHPPDRPVRIVAWVMVSCSAIVVVMSYRWLKRLTGETRVVP